MSQAHLCPLHRQRCFGAADLVVTINKPASVFDYSGEYCRYCRIDTVPPSDTFLLSNQDVSKSRAVLIHPGNNGGDTVACLLPGATKGQGTVGGSVKKMDAVRAFVHSRGANNVKVIITENIRH